MLLLLFFGFGLIVQFYFLAAQIALSLFSDTRLFGRFSSADSAFGHSQSPPSIMKTLGAGHKKCGPEELTLPIALSGAWLSHIQGLWLLAIIQPDLPLGKIFRA